MIRVSVLCPNSPGAKFDHKYYVTTHFDLVRARLGKALVKIEADKGLAGGTPGSPAPYIAAAHLLFKTLEDFQKSFGPNAKELQGDIPNFTSIPPVIQISEVTSS